MAKSEVIITEISIEKGLFEPVSFPVELLFLLWGEPDLLGIFLGLRFLAEQRFGFYMGQAKIADLLNMSEPTFIKKRKKLEDLGVVDVEMIQSGDRRQIKLILKSVQGSQKFYESLKNFKSLKKFKSFSNHKEVKELLEFSRRNVFPIDRIPMGPLFESDNIYNNPNNITSNNIANSNIANKPKTNSSNDDTRVDIPKGKTYPIADYDKVLKAYMQYKGIVLMGPELAGGRKAIKMMFLASRTPDQIIGFMKWIYQNEDDEEHGVWLKGKWNLWTVQKKIAEYLGGKFGKKMSQDVEIYGSKKN